MVTRHGPTSPSALQPAPSSTRRGCAMSDECQAEAALAKEEP